MSDVHRRIEDMKRALLLANEQGFHLTPELEVLINDYTFVILAYEAARKMLASHLENDYVNSPIKTIPSAEVCQEEADDMIQEMMIEMRNRGEI